MYIYYAYHGTACYRTTETPALLFVFCFLGNSYSQFGLRGRAPRGVTGELSPASVYVSLLPVVEACVVVAVPGRVGEVRVAADEPEAVDLDPGVLAPS